ncbi:DUF4112 domain-containing protein [Granulosicoccus antarcticus]|uniref:DUF4112 domain-containing protein n=1 Tax=Granulosicoccus antarcticus IMCC3135 TaxID=1192854 RepID=A0A2Z2NY35_9GAMM|nr:DUF4112 domain-containing protein [Granulosicoccus antarcticus]ASJ73750.1 hypothetical protein IMCC3135_18355 [Granulosicoccus antarcticus IMCC3135]
MINDKTPQDQKQVQLRLERLAHLMDSSIRLPGGFRIGLDGIIGLIPGIGDAIGLLISSYLIGKAATIGASRLVLARMVGNVLLETLLGSVPLIGDLFDFAFRANNKNMQLLHNHQMNAANTHKRSGWWLLLTLSVLVIVGAVILRLLWWFISSLYAVIF